MIRPSLRALLLPVLLAAAACHRTDLTARASTSTEHDGPSTQATPAVVYPGNDGPQAPAVVKLVLLEQSGNQLRLRAEIRKQAPFAVPLSVQVSTPAGVQLMEGPAAWEVSADASPGTYTRELTLRISAPSNESLRLTAHAQGAGFGVHATDVFRLSGGPGLLGNDSDETVPMPRPTGPGLKVGNTEFGNTVPNP